MSTIWMQTYTRKRFYPTDPWASDIDIRDIAHALALVNRYNGHTPAPYSVAQHSVLVAERVMELTGDHELALWGLLHDASEAYICDVPRPVKRQLAGYAEVERSVMAAICTRFDLAPEEPAVVKRADNELLATEARDLMGIRDASWGLTCDPLDHVDVWPWPWQRAEDAFLDLFHGLVECLSTPC